MLKKVLLASIALVATPAEAKDDWWMAESDHFRVISEGGKSEAEKVAVNLERLDQAMRLFRGLPLDSGEVRDGEKVTLYQTGRTSDIGDLAHSQGVAGFFIPRAGNSVAFVPLEPDRESRGRLGARKSSGDELRPEQVLFHEYTHYFSRQHAPAAYPFWYSEGFAELFATIQFTEDGFNLGEPPKYRGFVISELSFDVEDILDLDSERGKVRGMDIMRQYAYGWMFTSYLSFEPSRQGQLAEYLRLVTAGTPNLDAARQAFGDLDQLQKELEKYRRARALAIAVKYPQGSEPTVELHQLSEAEAAAMPLHIRSTAGVTKSQADGVASSARSLLARYPNSPAVLDTAMEAEFDAENFAEAQSLANRLLAADPQSLRAHKYLAMVALEKAKTDPAQIESARAELIAANKIDPERPDILLSYFNTFVFANKSIPEDAKIGLESAFRISPFASDIRTSLAYLLLLEKRNKEAFIILDPVVNLPHAKSEEMEELREKVAKAKAGDTAELMEELRPKIDDDEDDEDD